jgi:hypothetical protein
MSNSFILITNSNNNIFEKASRKMKEEFSFYVFWGAMDSRDEKAFYTSENEDYIKLTPRKAIINDYSPEEVNFLASKVNSIEFCYGTMNCNFLFLKKVMTCLFKLDNELIIDNDNYSFFDISTFNKISSFDDFYKDKV